MGAGAEEAGGQVMNPSKLFVLIGHPVKYSPSPAMQNSAFEATGLDYIYVSLNVPPGMLPDAVAGMRALGISGANVTIPYKVTIVKLLDELDKSARVTGAVNTIKNCSGKLTGFNTDGDGAIMALMESGINPRSKNVLLLGAGGAAKAIAFSLIKSGAELTIANRTVPRAKSLAAEIEDKTGKHVQVSGLNKKTLGMISMKSDVIINATSVGMYPDSGRTILTSKMIPRESVVFDIVYKPRMTRLLREARKAGARTIPGEKMLVYQGALSYEIWTGKKAPVEIMRTAVERELRRLPV